MKIIVLAGGISTERDVSLASGACICQALLDNGHQAFLLDVYLGFPYEADRLEEVFTLPDHGMSAVNKIQAEEPDLEAVKASRSDSSSCFFGPNVISLCQMADITFIGLHGGDGESGKLQAAFDMLGIRYTGPGYLGCAAAMDKGFTKEIFQQSGIPTTKGICLYRGLSKPTLSDLGYSLPVVVKPCSGGSSIGVYIANTQEEYEEAIEKSFEYEDEIIVEEYVKAREFACGVIDNQALPPIEIVPKSGFFDYANKYQKGATDEFCPARISEELTAKMQEITVQAFQALKLNVYSRADFLLDDEDNLYCLEVNTLPGMTRTSLLPREAQAAGISYDELCELLIQKSMEVR